MSTQEHLDWLICLLQPPFREAWRRYVWDRAKEIARDPQHAALPDMLKAAMQGPGSSASTP